MFVTRTFPRYLIRCAQYVHHGYHHYALGEVPLGKDPALVDAKLLARYQVSRSRQIRSQRRRAGESNVVYIRFGRRFLLMADGNHQRFLEEERPHDCRVRPIIIYGHSVGIRRGGVCVEIAPDRFAAIAKSAKAIALHNKTKVTAFFASISPLKFQGVIQQQKLLLDSVNDRRRQAGLPVVGVGEIWKVKTIYADRKNHKSQKYNACDQ